MKILLISFCIF